jgi:hypothetical protein
MIHSLTFRMTGSMADAKDLAQETFVRAYRQLDSYQGASRFSSWLYRIAVNADHLPIGNKISKLRRERPISAAQVENPLGSLQIEFGNELRPPFLLAGRGFLVLLAIEFVCHVLSRLVNPQPSGSYIRSRQLPVPLCVSCSLSTTPVRIIRRLVRILQVRNARSL